MTARVKTNTKQAAHHLSNWMVAEHSKEKPGEGKIAENVGHHLTISRESGTGASEIARKVGERLGWDVLDREIIDQMAAHYNTPRWLIELVDEKHVSWLEDFFHSWIQGLKFTSTTYVHRLSHLMLLAAQRSNVVVVGRGARFILPRRSGFSVRIVAPRENRVKRIMAERGLNERKARQLIHELDYQREAFVREHFHHRADDPHSYDLTVNVENLTQDEAVDLICYEVQSWLRKCDLANQSQQPT